MEDLQLVLFVLGAIAIIAVLVHGFWSIKKERQAKASFGDKYPFMSQDSDAQNRDRDGFDEFGVGDVIVKPSSDGDDASVNNAALAEPKEPVAVSSAVNQAPQSSTAKANDLQQDLAEELFELSTTPSKSVRKEPVVSQVENQEFKQDQMPLDLGEIFSEEAAVNHNSESLEVEPQLSIEPSQTRDAQLSTAKPEAIEVPTEEEQLGDPVDVLVLHLVAKEGEVLNGDELLPCLLTLNFKFGDMNIFHRHQDNAGTGKVLFSLANMVKPGIFDPDTMEQFTTPGVVLFLPLPCYGDALLNFSNMLNSAHQLADDLDAVVLDGQRDPWTEHVKLSYVQRIKSLKA